MTLIWRMSYAVNVVHLLSKVPLSVIPLNTTISYLYWSSSTDPSCSAVKSNGLQQQYSSVYDYSVAPIAECSVFLAHFCLTFYGVSFSRATGWKRSPSHQVSPDIPTWQVAESFFVEKRVYQQNGNKLPLQLCLLLKSNWFKEESISHLTHTHTTNNNSWEPLHAVKGHFCVIIHNYTITTL